MKYILLFAVLLIGVAYIGYANGILVGKISDIDRAVLLGLALMGNYYLWTNLINLILTLVLKKMSRN